MSEKLETLQGMAERLAVHPETLRRHAKAGKIPAVRIGRAWRFNPQAVGIATSTTPAKSEAPQCG